MNKMVVRMDKRQIFLPLKLALFSFFIHFLYWACIFLIVSIVSSVFIKLDSEGDFISWERMETPPGDINHIRAGDAGEVLLYTTDGGLYEWRSGAAWTKVQTPSGKGPIPAATCRSVENYDSLSSKYPFAPTEKISVDCFYIDASTHYEFILSTDHEMWKWEQTTGDLSMLGPAFTLAILSILLWIIFTPVIILLIIFVIRKNRIIQNIKPIRWYELLLSGIPAVCIILGGLFGSSVIRGGIFLGAILGAFVALIGVTVNIHVFLSRLSNAKKYLIVVGICFGLQLILILLGFYLERI